MVDLKLWSYNNALRQAAVEAAERENAVRLEQMMALAGSMDRCTGERMDAPPVHVSVSRCLYCGRRTAHEVCRHEENRCHMDVDAGWTNRDLPPEECPAGCTD